jgi:AbrB family looped-hinge helix DNA binding protein
LAQEMTVTTLSRNFRITIPKEIREAMQLKPGQKFVFLRRGRTLQLVPQATIDEFFGIARGADTSDYRDHTDRLDRYAQRGTGRTSTRKPR